MRHPILSTALVGWAAVLAPLVSAQEDVLLAGSEQDAATDTMQDALEHNPTKQASEWVNPDTGRSGAVALGSGGEHFAHLKKALAA